MGDYAGYVIAAYAVTFGGIAALIAWTVLDRVGARRALGRAERAASRAGDAAAGNARDAA
ncbi:heme exporter protein CcmD [Acuticoccus mangrovi]|uniref:Heme exporter protein D n=1 Tax=Acuticoccus mangrovi TaxID=2796142 RepID=A0A934IU05_9HYPH|nr:heme exporter protein CcmD [Acuticoccus mangrovi]MBJ3778730.1 heme exporter protein CcmD [Acuticoccus mangrovi]